MGPTNGAPGIVLRPSTHGWGRGQWTRLALYLALISGLVIVPRAVGQERLQSVLVVASFEAGDAVEQAQIEALQAALPMDVELIIDHLDATWIGRRRNYLPLYFGIVHRKYKHHRLDAVVALNDDAIRFVDYFRTNIFAGVPLVLCGSETNVARKFPHMDNWTGVFCAPDPSRTIQLSLALHPAARKVHVITDGTTPGRRAAQQIHRAMTAGDFAVPVVLSEKEPVWTYDRLRREVRQFEADSTVFFAEFSRDYGGVVFQPRRLMPLLSADSAAPIYSQHRQAIGAGAVGGYVVDGKRMGHAAGEMLRGILAGESPTAIPPVVLDGEWVFDDVQLKRWGIPDHRLPSGCRIIGRRPTFIERNKWLLLAGVSVIGVEFLIIALLLVNRAGRIRAQRALQASEVRYRTLFEASDDLFMILDRSGCILHANPAACRLLGYSLAELTGKPQIDLVVPTDRTRLRVGLDRVLGGEKTMLEADCLTREGEEMPVEILLQPFAGGGRSAAVCVARNLSERIKIQRLTQEISERERQAMGCDLHDGLGQYLTALRFQCRRLEKGAAERQPLDAAEVETLNQIVSELTFEMRSMARSLVPQQMISRTLESALEELMEINVRHLHIQAQVDVLLDEGRLLPDVAAQLYRIVQEAMRNAVRHGGASWVQTIIRTTEDGNTAELVIENNGQPFDHYQKRRAGMGLAIMEHRARLIGGTLDIRPAEDGRMRLTCRFPLPKPPGNPMDSTMP